MRSLLLLFLALVGLSTLVAAAQEVRTPQRKTKREQQSQKPARQNQKPAPADDQFPTGNWRAWLVIGDGHQLHFEFEVQETARGGYRTFIKNGDERIEVRRTQWNQSDKGLGVLRLSFPHYDSVLRGVLQPGRRSIQGYWYKRQGAKPERKLHFIARHEEGPRFPKILRPGIHRNVAGRWEVNFNDTQTPAIMILQQADQDEVVTGTILTSTGGYRFLEGTSCKGLLRLSVFDGAHAFYLSAEYAKDGTLKGVFKSGNWYETKWTARRNADAVLPDPMLETKLHKGARLTDLSFPNLNGELTSLADPKWAGHPMIVNLFGSWCPNCHDEAELLNDLQAEYGPLGLRIVGLAFELPGDMQRSIDQVARFRRRHQTAYATLIAGNTPKDDSTRALGVVDQIRSYPTSMFIRRDGTVAGIHTGFIGPAAGAEHVLERARFEELVGEIMGSEALDTARMQSGFGTQAWTQGNEQLHIENGQIWHRAQGTAKAGFAIGAEGGAIFVPGGVWLGDVLWRVDYELGVAWNAADPDRHVLRQREGKAALGDLASADASKRCAAIVQRQALGDLALEQIQLRLNDPVPAVQALAVWAAGVGGHEQSVERLAELGSHAYAPLAREVQRALTRLAK